MAKDNFRHNNYWWQDKHEWSWTWK